MGDAISTTSQSRPFQNYQKQTQRAEEHNVLLLSTYLIALLLNSIMKTNLVRAIIIIHWQRFVYLCFNIKVLVHVIP